MPQRIYAEYRPTALAESLASALQSSCMANSIKDTEQVVCCVCVRGEDINSVYYMVMCVLP